MSQTRAPNSHECYFLRQWYSLYGCEAWASGDSSSTRLVKVIHRCESLRQSFDIGEVDLEVCRRHINSTAIVPPTRPSHQRPKDAKKPAPALSISAQDFLAKLNALNTER